MGRSGSMKNVVVLLSTAILVIGCNGINPIKTASMKVPPYKRYLKSLEEAELDQTVMARQWISAGENALQDSIIISLPFSESGYFLASQPASRSYRFDARKGQVLTIDGSVVTKSNVSVFLDLFMWNENQWTPIANGDSTISLSYEFDTDRECLLRLQPELLVTVNYSIAISLTPVLINPVAGATNQSIRSFYGDSRDGGKRRHEGIDIFAKKGTPVVAPTTGYITRVGTGKLGGRVVWMQDTKRGHSYYFAHLDEQFVRAGTVIQKGDTLGTVGNTGNARHTPSHLHFGIYQHGSLDPVHFVKTLEGNRSSQPWDTTVQEFDYKVISKIARVQMRPADSDEILTTLSKDAYLQIIAQTENWYRVLLPNNKQGFILKNKIAPIRKGKRLRISQPADLLSEASVGAVPLTKLRSSTAVEVLANFENFKFVRTREGLLGWLLI